MEIAERIDAAYRTLLPYCSDPTEAHWIGGSDESTSWCHSCAKKEVARLTKKSPGDEFSIDGGYAAHESEGSVVCNGCGIEVCAILEQAPYMDATKDTEIVLDMLRIGETAVQLIGYRDELARWADDGGPCP